MAKKPKKTGRSTKKLDLKTPTGVYRIFNLGIAITILVILTKSTQTDGQKTVWFYLSVASLPVTALVGFVLSFLLGSHKEDPSLRSGVMRLWALSNNGIISVVLVVIMVFSYIVPYQRKIEEANPCYGVKENDKANLNEREVLVLFANFKGLNNATNKPDEQWIALLPNRLKEAVVEQNIRFVEISRVVKDHKEAKKYGDCYDATLIVSGEVFGDGIKVRYTPTPRWSDVGTLGETYIDPNMHISVEPFINNGGDMEYVINALIAQLLYFEHKYEEVLDYTSVAINFAHGNFSDRLVEMDVIWLVALHTNSLQHLGEFQLAVDFLLRYIELNRSDPVFWNILGAAYDYLEQYDQAVGAYNQAILIDPEYADAYSNRGIALNYQGRFYEAVQDFTKAISIEQYPKPYQGRAVSYNSLGRYDEAIRDLNICLKLDSNYVPALITRGSSYYYLGNYQQALDDLNKAIDIDSTMGAAYNNRGYVYHAIGHHDLGDADFDKAASLGFTR